MRILLLLITVLAGGESACPCPRGADHHQNPGFIAAAITEGVSEPKVLLPTGFPTTIPRAPPISASTRPIWWSG